jgi:hypothetical protein
MIVDYVFYWTRDIYRPGILRLLTSIATGRYYDEMSVITDSDIVALNRATRSPAASVRGLIPPLPSSDIVEDDEPQLIFPPRADFGRKTRCL